MDRAEYLKLPQQFHILLILNIEQQIILSRSQSFFMVEKEKDRSIYGVYSKLNTVQERNTREIIIFIENNSDLFLKHSFYNHL